MSFKTIRQTLLSPSGIGRKTLAFKRRLQFGFLRRDLGTKSQRHIAEENEGTKMQRHKVTETKEKTAVSALCLCRFVPLSLKLSASADSG
jgi:hypothetical protein